MSAGRLPQNLLILLYKIKNNEVSLNMVNGGGGGNRTQISSRTLVTYHKTLQILTLNETLSHHI
jgi:hypothetical protein